MIWTGVNEVKLTAVYIKAPEGCVLSSKNCLGLIHNGQPSTLDSNRQLSAQSLEGVDFIREALVLQAA